MRRLLAAALVAATLSAPGTAAAQAIRIGELNSYKTFAAFLEPYRKGMDLAIEEINRAGGIKIGRAHV